MPINVAINEGNHSTTVMTIAREKQDNVLLHLYSEIGPANALGVNISEEQ